MSTLTLQLAGPLQSWGSASRFTRRNTDEFPTKSGVIGLLASALGLARDADLSRLVGLRFGVRIDQPGRRVRDFQTVHDLDTGGALPLSERYYLADAVFLAAVEGETGLLEELDQALQAPAFMPYLGRRSCPPAREIRLRIHRGDLESALTAEPWLASAWHQRLRARRGDATVKLSTLIEPRSEDAQAFARSNSMRDQPISFDPRNRRYALRAVTRGPVVEKPNPAAETVAPAEHNEPPSTHEPTRGLKEA